MQISRRILFPADDMHAFTLSRISLRPVNSVHLQRMPTIQCPLSAEWKKRQTGKLIQAKEDIYYLSFDELKEAVCTNRLDVKKIEERKAEYRHYEKLTPPRIMTSEGEVITGEALGDHIPEEKESIKINRLNACFILILASLR